MNIFHYVDSTDARLGGVPRFVLDASRVMAGTGHPSTVLTLDTKDTPPEYLENHDGSSLPTVFKLPRPSLMGKLFGPGEMKIIRQQLQKADVLHLHGVWSPTVFQIAKAARQMRIPYVVSLHGMLDDWCMSQRNLKKRLFLALGGKTLLEQAARVHCTASAEVAQSHKWFPKGTATVIPCLMDLSAYRDLPGREPAAKKFAFLADSTTPTILFLSRLHYKKGIEHLLRAAAELKARGVKAQFALAGNGDPEYVQSLKDLSQQLALTDRVHFVGQVSGAEKVSLYQNATVFALPTSQENFGLVLIEALACGTPIITTKGVDIWRDVQESGAATIVDQNPSQLADAIANVIGDAPGRQIMSDKARPWVFKTYAEERLISQYEEMYQTCAAMGRKRALEKRETRDLPALASARLA